MDFRFRRRDPKHIPYAYCAGIAVGTLWHPFQYAKVLMQLGHEPLRPDRRTAFPYFQKDAYYWPNGLKYVRYIYRQKGFCGLYVGLAPSLCQRITGSIVAACVFDVVDQRWPVNQDRSGSRDEIAFGNFIRTSTCETVATSAGLIVSYPFKVIMIRKMAQFVGDEQVYTSIWVSFKQILDTEGLQGLFSGVVPALLGDILLIWSTNIALFALDRLWIRYVEPNENDVDQEEQEDLDDLPQQQELLGYKTLKKCVRYIVPLLMGSMLYPFALVSTVMAVNGSGLAAGHQPFVPVFATWQDAYQFLKERKQLHRGSKLFFRPCPTSVALLRSDKRY